MQYNEEIAVAGGDPERLTVRWTIWGPVLGTDFMGRLRAYALGGARAGPARGRR